MRSQIVYTCDNCGDIIGDNKKKGSVVIKQYDDDSGIKYDICEKCQDKLNVTLKQSSEVMF